jgi:hypothetical protein
MKRVIFLCLVMLGLVAACGQQSDIGPGHSASISCGRDGQVHISVSNYGEAVRVVDGGIEQPFHGGFTMELSGTSRHTIVITADDWPTFNESAGPCVQPTTSTTEKVTVPDSTTTTTICVDCIPNTNVTIPDGTTTTSTTTTCPDCVPNTQAAPTTTTGTPPSSGATTTTVVTPPVITTVPKGDPTTTTQLSAPPVPQPTAPVKGLPVTM